MQTISPTQPVKKKGVNKLVLGFAAVVASAVVGTTGLAAANSMGNSDKPSKQQCAAAGYSNYGQCVREWAHNRGGGYGNTNVNANIGLELNNSNNNVITVIINLFR